MSESLLLIFAIVCYFIATGLIVYYMKFTRDDNHSPGPLNLASIVASLGAIAHISYALNVSLIEGKLNFSLSSMMVLVGAILVLIYLLGSLVMPIRRLGVLVYPAIIISLLFATGWHDNINITDGATPYSSALSAHIFVSIMAYCLLAIATIQALLYVYQERQIKNRTNPSMLMALPPLQTMEQLLFRLVGIGFVLLTLTLLSGAIFSQQLFGHAFEFKHHTILAVMGWLVFAVLLFKRVKNGLRGSQAVAWTIGGFILIQLGYFGTKIISESLNVS